MSQIETKTNCAYLIPCNNGLGNSDNETFKNDFLVGKNFTSYQLRCKLRSKIAPLYFHFFCNSNRQTLIVSIITIMIILT